MDGIDCGGGHCWGLAELFQRPSRSTRRAKAPEASPSTVAEMPINSAPPKRATSQVVPRPPVILLNSTRLSKDGSTLGAMGEGFPRTVSARAGRILKVAGLPSAMALVPRVCCSVCPRLGVYHRRHSDVGRESEPVAGVEQPCGASKSHISHRLRPGVGLSHAGAFV